MNRSILLYGYCQARHIGRILEGIPSIRERFEICAIEVCADPVTGEYRTPPADILDRCELVCYQINEKDPTPDYVRRLIAQGRAVRFPIGICHPMWPQHADMKRQISEPGLPWGRFPYADRALLDLMEAGLDDEAILRDYLRMDIAEAFGAERLVEFWEYQLAQLDHGCDVPMADFIWGQWKKRRLFWAINHPTNEILGLVVRQMFARTIGPPPETELAETLRTIQLDEMMPPIHPSVARCFGLEWWSPRDLYRWPDGPFTIEQWALEHVRYARRVEQAPA